MRREMGHGKLQFRPSMARYTGAALVWLGIWTGFWAVVWFIFGATPLNLLVFVAVLLAIFLLSFVGPFLMLIDVEYGRIEGPDGFGSSAIALEDVHWDLSAANSLIVHIEAEDGRAITADRAHFSAEELEEMFLTFVGGTREEPPLYNEEPSSNELGAAVDC